ncbi:MAG: CDP-diacylglycerol--glycerol-3-phosphate 3-phosphatidyltransferase [Actinobacteria bacterium]|nr:CDP-diacylglycerol--glycerol-3-phosphate 3-phosphatidyltransferase [Actinomycetota bacterium]
MQKLPNLFTILRLLLVPIIVISYLFADGTNWFIFTLFFIAGLSDWIDGTVARKTGAITEFGKLWDPIADKLVIGAVLVLLTIDGVIPIFITVIILIRESAVTIARLAVLKHGVLAADRGGKLKTMLQGFSLLFLLSPYPLDGIALPMLYLATVITLITGVRYFGQLYELRSKNAS